MRRAALDRALGWARALRRRLWPRGLILLYHRVAETAIDPWHLSVTPAHFAEQLEVLARLTIVVPLSALPAALARARRGDAVVAITFDDGYADNLYQAKPLLERYGLPATVFVASGYVGRERYWWDELAHLILGPHPLPSRLELVADRVEWRADHIDAAPEGRVHLHRWLWHDLHLLSAAERDRLLAALAAWAGVELRTADGERPLQANEVGRLAEGGLIEIGAHSVTHPYLPALLSQAIREELVASKQACEGLVGAPVTSFAYPFGGVCTEAVRQVRDAGFGLACTTPPQVMGLMGRHGTDLLQLPRLGVDNWSGRVFREVGILI